MTEPIVSVIVDTTELQQLARACPPMAGILHGLMKDAITESAMYLAARTIPLVPVNYGLLRSSISFPTGFQLDTGAGTLDNLRGIIGAGDITGATGISTSTYVWFVEEDTRPHWPPHQPILLWVMRKFGLTGSEAESAAYGVQAKISKKGTTGKHMFRNAWQQGGEAQVRKIFTRIPLIAMQRFKTMAKS